MKVLLRTLLALTVLAGLVVVVGMNFDWFGTYSVRQIAKMLHIPVPRHRGLTPAENAAARAEAAAWKVKFTAEFPALMVAERSLPPDENGFLKLHVLDATRVPSEIDQYINEQDPWDAKVAKRYLMEHAEFVEKIESIAALTDRSSSSILANCAGIFNGKAAIDGSKILLLKARLAAEAGDEAETLRLLSATGNLGAHCSQIETPSLHTETVAILIECNIRSSTFGSLLPLIGKTADLERWKTVLGRKVYSTTELARVMRGEWNQSADFMVFPVAAMGEKTCEIRDAEALVRTYTLMFNHSVTEIERHALGDLPTFEILSPGPVPHLSRESRSLLEIATTGKKYWKEGYLRSACLHAQSQAALDLLILEKGGAVLTPADTGRATRDPASGIPFVFDTLNRQLSAPENSPLYDELPLKLPW